MSPASIGGGWHLIFSVGVQSPTENVEWRGFAAYWRFSDMMKDGEAGYFNKATGTLMINANAKNKYFLTAVHESIHAIRTIHARVVLCFKECLLLLKNGYSEGATEIWRTMYELTIVASFIKHHSNNKDLAQRYIDHIIVDNYKEENEYREQYKAPQRYTSNAFKKLKNNYNSVIEKYGKSFKNDYGWATIVLNKNKPSLRDLEVNIKNRYKETISTNEAEKISLREQPTDKEESINEGAIVNQVIEEYLQ